MRQQTETESYLEIRDSHRQTFVPCNAGMYQRARLLAQNGHAQEALNAAEEIHIEHYGQMHGVTFRVVTKTVTVSQHGPWEGFENL